MNISIDASQDLLRKEKRLRDCDEDNSDASVDYNDRSSDVEEMESTTLQPSLAEEEAANKVDLRRSKEGERDSIERQLGEMGEGSPPTEKQTESMDRESTSDHNSNRYQGIIVLKVSGCLLNY